MERSWNSPGPEGGFSFAVTAAYVDGAWQVSRFEDDFSDPATAERAARRSPGAAFALLCVDDDYFVLVRPTPKGVNYVLSDAVAAVEDDFAAQILDELGVDVPDLEGEDLIEAEAWAEGDLDILADFGLSEQVLEVIAEDEDSWASEQLVRLAEEIGLDEVLLDAVPGLDGLHDDD